MLFLGKNLYEEKHNDKKIHVVDSKSAFPAGGRPDRPEGHGTEEQGLSYEEIVKRLEDFRDEMNTYFVLNNLETLRKTAVLQA